MSESADALLELNERLRRMIDLTRRCDIARTSEATLREAADQLRHASDAIEASAHPGPFAQASLDGTIGVGQIEGEPCEIFPYSPVIGALNPIAPAVAFVAGEDGIHAEHVFDAAYAGPPATVHGGIVALVFDELLGCTNVAAGLGAFTGTLSVRYHRPTPLGRPVKMRGRIKLQQGRKVFTMGEIWDGDTLTAEAEGIFIRPAIANEAAG